MDKLKEAVKARLDVPGLLSDVMDDILEPALTKVVADTSNPFDDMAKAAIYPVLAVELKKLAKEQWEKLLP